MEQETVSIKLLTSDAKIPERKTLGSAGYDLFSNEDCILLPLYRQWVSTGISISLPQGLFGRILPRSSMSSLYIDTCAGVIDDDYRGEIKVLLMNSHPNNSYEIKKGMRICQLVIEKYYQIKFVSTNLLDDTIRGDQGFGSTGK
jgi:dUTP pyrophosphatase